jgi:hypothetical protein
MRAAQTSLIVARIAHAQKMHLALIESQRKSTVRGLAEEGPNAQAVRWQAAQANAKEQIKSDKLQRLQMFVWF